VILQDISTVFFKERERARLEFLCFCKCKCNRRCTAHRHPSIGSFLQSPTFGIAHHDGPKRPVALCGQKEKKRHFTNIDRAYSRLKVSDGYQDGYSLRRPPTAFDTESSMFAAIVSIGPSAVKVSLSGWSTGNHDVGATSALARLIDLSLYVICPASFPCPSTTPIRFCCLTSR
jgi:hypothetical protein